MTGCTGKFIIGLLAALLLPTARAAAWQTCHLAGQRDALRCTFVTVPRDYAAPDHGSIELHVAVAPAIRARGDADPLYVLAGGPGQAGSDIVSLLDDAFAKVHASRDIVFIDQRGTGRSGRLHCDDDALDRSDAELRASVMTCLKGFGSDLLAYSTEASAQDLERVRQALGHAQINLWGGSYGSRLAQVYAQRYPAHVRSLILDGVVDEGRIIGTNGSGFQFALDALLRRCENDADCAQAFPRLDRQLADLLHRLDVATATPTVAHPRHGRPITVPISRERLLRTIRYQLYSTRTSARLPYLIARAAVDDWRPLIATESEGMDLVAAPPAAGLLLALPCREDWPRFDAPRRAEEARGGLFSGVGIDALDRVCRELALPPLPAPAAQPLAIPGLLLSGALDPATPASGAERALRHLPRAQHVVAANAGHIVSTLGCAPALLRRFLDTPQQPVDAGCLADIALPALQISAAGTAP